MKTNRHLQEYCKKYAPVLVAGQNTQQTLTAATKNFAVWHTDGSPVLSATVNCRLHKLRRHV